MHRSIDVRKRNGHFASDAQTTVFVHEMGFEARSWANGRRAMPFRLTLAIILMPSRRNMPLLSPPPLSLPCRQIPFFVHSRPLDGGGDADETVVAACYLTRAGRSTVRARSSLWSIGPVSIDARRADRPRAWQLASARVMHARIQCTSHYLPSCNDGVRIFSSKIRANPLSLC